MNGTNGTNGTNGGNPYRSCLPTNTESARAPGVDPSAPLSGMVALTLVDPGQTGATNLADYVKALVLKYAQDQMPTGIEFPLKQWATDSLRAIPGVRANVVVKWFDPLTFNNGKDAPRFGGNADYIAWFGDGWNSIAGNPPQWQGGATSGWIWSNHEYVSADTSPTGVNILPSTTPVAPAGQALTLAKFLRSMGILSNVVEAGSWQQADIDIYLARFKREIGGSYFRVVQDPATCEWSVDRSANGVRYDGTSATQLKMTGYTLPAADHDDAGAALPAQVIAGTLGNCSGGQTPWGTIITAEENTQEYYGDIEPWWDSNQGFVAAPPVGSAAPGAAITWPFATATDSLFGSSMTANPNAGHARNLYGWAVEIDPGVSPSTYEGKAGAGIGHKKLGAMGRARWENAAFVTDASWKPLDGKPIVVYWGDDRRGGRVFKYVSSNNYSAGMSRASARALLDAGKLYVAHFAGLDNAKGDVMKSSGQPPWENTPGMGQWIELSLTSGDIAPNASALGTAGKTVSMALQDNQWNGIGGFATQDDVLRGLFTAANKLGVMELNRPEDVEWNPKDMSGKPRLYIAFTNHTGRTALDQNGVRAGVGYGTPAVTAAQAQRTDAVGSIFALEEADPSNPAASKTFKFFMVFRGARAGLPLDAACPDQLMIDKDGGVWFGTDGNFGATSKKASDSIYYLDLDPKHNAGEKGIARPTVYNAFRVVSVPSDAEATGPAFTSDMGTLFMNVQHPGEGNYSAWP